MSEIPEHHSKEKVIRELSVAEPDLHAVILRTCVVTPKNKKAFTEYEIIVFEQSRSWIIRRRYRQFHALNEHLKNSWGTIVPKNFPPKALKKNLSPYLIDRRHQLLQNWMFLVVHNKNLVRDKKLRLFLTAEALPMNINEENVESETERIADPVPLNTSIEAMGFLYQFKKGVCKRRWFALRTGMLYKYHYPKEKHPYRQYELKDTIAASANLKSPEELKLKRSTGSPRADKSGSSPINSPRENKSNSLTPRENKPSKSPRKALGLRDSSEEGENNRRSSAESSKTTIATLVPRIVTPKPTVESVLDWKNAFCVECGRQAPLVFIAETEVDRDCWVIAFNKQQDEKTVPLSSLESIKRFSLTTNNPRPISVRFDSMVDWYSAEESQQQQEDTPPSSVESVEPKGELFGRDLATIRDRTEAGIPTVIAQILDYLLTREGAELSLPQDSSAIAKAIESDQKIDFDKIANPATLIDIILLWLSELPKPLFPAEFYDCFFSTFNVVLEESRSNIQHAIIAEMPKSNRAILGKILQCLSVILARNSYTEIIPTMFARYIFRPNSLHEQNGMALYVFKELIINYEVFQEKKGVSAQAAKRRLQLMHSLQKNANSAELPHDLIVLQKNIEKRIEENRNNRKPSVSVENKQVFDQENPTISQLEAEFKDWTFEDSSDGEGEYNEFSVDEAGRVKANMDMIMASRSISRNTTVSSMQGWETSELSSDEDYDEDIDGSGF